MKLKYITFFIVLISIVGIAQEKNYIETELKPNSPA